MRARFRPVAEVRAVPCASRRYHATRRERRTSRHMRLLRGPLTMLLIAAGVGAASILPTLRKSTAVEIPLTQEGRSIRSPTFRADYSEDYLVEVDLEKPLKLDASGCVTPEGRPISPCERPVAIAVAWTVTRRGRLVGSGPDIAPFSNGGREISLGRVPLIAGHSYQLEVRPEDLAAIAPMKPKIAIRVHPMAYKDAVAVGGIGTLLSGSLGLVGLVGLGRGLRSQRKTGV